VIKQTLETQQVVRESAKPLSTHERLKSAIAGNKAKVKKIWEDKRRMQSLQTDQGLINFDVGLSIKAPLSPVAMSNFNSEFKSHDDTIAQSHDTRARSEAIGDIMI
jgi:hypothetical protein